MDNYQIPIQPHSRGFRAVWNGLRRMVLIEKLKNPLGIFILSIIGAIVAAGIAKGGVMFAVLMMLAAFAIPTVYALVVYPQFGLMVYLTMAYLVGFLGRAGVNFPIGTLMDGMLVLFFLGLFIQQKKKTNWQILQGPYTVALLTWIGYNFMEVANPAAEAKLAWVFTVRTVAMLGLSYFIFLYNIKTKAFIKLIFKWWIALCFIGAIYAFKQEYFGFADFEERFLHSDPNIELLLFIAGHWRKFSYFSDPVTFAYNMVTASLVCIALITGPISKNKKIVLGFVIFTLLLNMIYSGTRGAFPLAPAALVLYAIIKFSKKVFIFFLVAIVFTVGLIFMPTSNQNILRFQSAFRPNDDASYKVRKFNQARIKPYVWSHPIGGGLGATGDWGKKFAPNSYLASFPPDSGYVRVTVELGWIGLSIFCVMMFTILKIGINNYYAIRDPELKSYCLAAVLVLFALNIANFPQEALVQFPSNVNFYLSAALIGATYRIDQEQNKLLNL